MKLKIKNFVSVLEYLLKAFSLFVIENIKFMKYDNIVIGNVVNTLN